jgi:uncharacterized protein YecA (UPF0149 family)
VRWFTLSQNWAYDLFIEPMANIKNEVLNNRFRSTSNLQAFENFMATLPQFLQREHAPTAPIAGVPAQDRPRNEPCPCGSGKKYKNCGGRVA